MRIKGVCRRIAYANRQRASTLSFCDLSLSQPVALVPLKLVRSARQRLKLAIVRYETSMIRRGPNGVDGVPGRNERLHIGIGPALILPSGVQTETEILRLHVTPAG